jgi:short-subunit dehydrogenase
MSQLKRLVETTTAANHRLDFMFNNAGIGAWGDVRCFADRQWQQIVDVNLWGAVHGTTAALAVMALQGDGHIVNTASLAGLVPVPAAVPYATAKHAVVGLSTSVRAEVATLGVRVSVVCPGPVRSSFHQSLVLADGALHSRKPSRIATDSRQAAREILAGVERNKAVIVFPRQARLTWIAYRICPALLGRIHRGIVENLTASWKRESSRGAAQGETGT